MKFVNALKEIKSLKFSTISTQEIDNLSVVEVSNQKLYSEPKTPQKNGPLDLKMGAFDNKDCETCNQDKNNCVGHFGHVNLIMPVFNSGFIKNAYVFLQCICKSCSSPLINCDGYDKINFKATQEIAEKSKKVKICKNCNSKVEKIKRTGLRIIFTDYNTNSTEIITAAKCLAIFGAIPASFQRKLDFRPSDFLIEKLLVLPLALRPTAFISSSKTNEDDLTIKLTEIIFINNTILNNLSKNISLRLLINDYDLLQLNVNMYLNGQDFKSIVQRLKGKAGRFRSNLSGKRVDFSGRTVITPDPFLKINEVGVPREIAKILTIPEFVNEKNIEKMRKLLKNGSNYPGASYLQKNIQKKDGTVIQCKKFLIFCDLKKEARNLRVGDILERHLADGDHVIFNRQPSLHRISLMCHRARISDTRTLSFNESVCNPYNADFDGDEMNIHVPQDLNARVEANELMGVNKNVINVKDFQMTVMPIQDFITYVFRLTNHCFIAAKTLVADFAVDFKIQKPAIQRPEKIYTGHQIFETLVVKAVKTSLAENKNKKKFADFNLNYAKNDVIFKNNKFISGNITKKDLKNLLEHLHNLDPAFCNNLTNNISKSSASLLHRLGLSIGFDDVNIFRDKKPFVMQIVDEIENLIKSNKEALKIKELSKLRELLGNSLTDKKYKKGLNLRNSTFQMYLCGSKGSLLNIIQMVASLGQQIIGGERVKKGYGHRSFVHDLGEEREIALGHFAKDLDRKEHLLSALISRGFIPRSFYDGLSPINFFSHAISGREGLVDTAVKTAETGYMQRRLVKCLEDGTYNYDGSVRFCRKIVSFTYIESCNKSNMFDFAKLDPNNKFIYFLVRLIKENSSDSTFEVFMSYSEERKENIFNLIEKYFRSILNKFISTKGNAISSEIHRKVDKIILKRQENMIKNMFKILSPGCVLNRRKIKYYTHYILSTIQSFLPKNEHYMSPVGPLAAQSIGEPGTQMTLKTFHFAGAMSMNITLGVPRLKEIINATEKISTSIIDITLESEKMAQSNFKESEKAKILIEPIFFKNIIDELKIIYSKEKIEAQISLNFAKIRKIGEAFSLKGEKILVEKIFFDIISEIKSFLKIEEVYYEKELIIISLRSEILQTVYKIKKEMPEIKIFGMKNIKKVLIKESESGDQKYSLVAEGNDFHKILGLNFVETAKTNNIIEIYTVLGIEAARCAIFNEIVFTLKSHGISIRPEHISLLSDTMCVEGTVNGATRYGIVKNRKYFDEEYKISPFMMASFEQTAEYLYGAASGNINDNLRGMSEQIIMGKKIELGTGSVDLCLN